MKEGLTYLKLQASRLVRVVVTTPPKALVMNEKLVREWNAGGGTAASVAVAESYSVPISYGRLFSRSSTRKVFLLIPRVHLRS